MDRTHKPKQKWLAGLEPSMEEINRELALIPVSYRSVDISCLDPSREPQSEVKRPDPSDKQQFLTCEFFVKTVSASHPDCSVIRSDTARVAKLTQLVLEDPEKVLRQYASALRHVGLVPSMVVQAVTTIGNLNLPDEQQWQTFNEKLRVFMGIVGPPTSGSLSKKECKRLIDLGFGHPKTAKILAGKIRDYLLLIEDGR